MYSDYVTFMIYMYRDTYVFKGLHGLKLVFKGLHGLKLFMVELKHIITPTKLLARPGVVSVTIYIHMLYSCMSTLKYSYIYMYALLVFHSCFNSLDICNCCNPPLLTCIHLYSCFTRTLLVIFLLCVRVCVRRLTGLVECVEQSEGLRRDGAWCVAAEDSW
jgi:hypothetical protein